MKYRVLLLAAAIVLASGSIAHATVFTGVMDNRAGFPNVPGFTAQSLAWIVGGNNGEGLRLEWQADDVTTPGSWTYTYRLIRGFTRNKGFAYFDIETAPDFTSANIISRQVLSATNRLGTPVSLSGITISDPVTFNAVHDFSNAAISETVAATALSKADLSHYSGDPGRTVAGRPGGTASATPTEGPKAHPFYGMRVTFPGSFASLSYVVSEWEFRIVSDRVPMWGRFFGWGDQTTVGPYWYSNFYNDAIDTPGRPALAPADSLSGADPYRGWILVPGPLPSVIAANPGDPAPGVPAVDTPTGDPVTVVFDGLMDPTTITAATFTLTDVSSGGTTVPGAVAYDTKSRTATFTPDSPLLTTTTYAARITTGVRDLAGNPLPANKEWSFSTTAADITPPSVLTLSPVSDARDSATSSQVAAVFSEAVDPATLTAAAFTVTDGNVSISGTIAYSSATRTATFTPQAPLANNAVYTATLSTAVTDRSGNHLTQDTSWNFTTIPRETILPIITATVPTDGLGNISISTPISATFSESIDPATINGATFSVAGIAGTVTYDAASLTATFTPEIPLANSTTYTATATTAVKDLAGNSLPITRVWSFTTGPPDVIAPTVISTQPTVVTNVPLDTTISAVFSEPMDLATIGPASFTLTGQTFASTAPFSVSGSISNNTFTPISQFIPTVPLIMGTAYTATITTAVTDQAGNHLAVDKTWSFVTLPDGILQPGETVPTVLDALKALRIAVNLMAASPDDMRHGDTAPLGLDGKPQPDGIIDLRDALMILRKVVGLISW